jgi:hypothetical protein
LAYAIDVAAQETQLANHAKQAIFYITPLPVDRDLDQIPILAARAADTGIPVYVWLVANETSTNSQAADALRDLAETTGGQFFFYSEKVETPSPETYLSRCAIPTACVTLPPSSRAASTASKYW